MGSFRDMPAEDGLSYGLSLLYRSGWAGTDPALIQLRALMEGLLAFDLTGAVYAYHQLTAALLQKGDRRVSGDLFKDHLLGLAVHEAHAFARMAAKGQRDEAPWMLMQEELSVLGSLSQLTSQDVARYTRERQQALAMRPRQGKDALSVVATAAWGGGSTRPLPREDGEGPIPQPGPFLKAPFAFTPWQYGEPGLTDAFAADEALEEIYLRLLSAKDWGQLTEDLYNFFASYGCGPFLQHRGFRLEPDGSLTPLPESAFAPLIPTSLYEGERVRLMENTIRFLRGEPSENVLLYGGAGTGKTAYVLSLLHEFPAARLILADPGDPTALTRLLQTLAGQPLRFLVLLDHWTLPPHPPKPYPAAFAAAGSCRTTCAFTPPPGKTPLPIPSSPWPCPSPIPAFMPLPGWWKRSWKQRASPVIPKPSTRPAWTIRWMCGNGFASPAPKCWRNSSKDDIII